MFDTGADRSYLTNDLVNALTPRWIDREPVAFASFGSGKPSKSKLRDIFSVSLQDANGMDHTLLATAVDVICAPLFRPEIPKQTLDSFGEISFTDRYDCGFCGQGGPFDWLRCVLEIRFTTGGKL